MRFATATVLLICALSSASAGESTFRLTDGVTVFVSNPEGREFTLTLDVQDINIFETGPREVLWKVYDPDGKAVVREVIPDDGVTSQAYQQPAAAWDHEAWFYAYCRMQGMPPMLRWSAFSEPDRLATIPKRTFNRAIPAGKPGVYRVLLVGAIDHYATLQVDPELSPGVAGNPSWLHGRQEMYRRSLIYVPRGSRGLHLVFLELDVPRTRRFTLKAADGTVLFDGGVPDGFLQQTIDFDPAGKYDEQLLTFEVSAGRGDFMFDIKHRFAKSPEVKLRGEPVVSAVLAPDADTARAIQGGAIYHDERVFWHPFQVRLHEWLKRLGPEDFIVRDGSGDEIKVTDLPKRDEFFPVNGRYARPPLSDVVMHHWPAHRNRAALNLAVRDLAAGLRSIGPNDCVAVGMGDGPYANLAYEFGNYAWQYWRPAWRMLQDPEVPDDLKTIVHEAFIACGDRLAFCRSWARINGNAFAQVVSALKYSSAATNDPLQQKLFNTYFDRFSNGGWGERVGIGPSGPVQESFGYAYHYASYILETWQSVLADFDDPRFQKVHDRIRNWFSYTLADERIAAGAWSSRTHVIPPIPFETEGPFAWKGLPGPDFTVGVNDADEWFAARRKNYYVLTYHGRLSPKWNSNAGAGQTGYGGGMLCQFHIPGQGPVLASTLNGDYGRKMHPTEWRTFHIHSVVGTHKDGSPLVAADSEHLDARLKDQTVTGSGEVRLSSVHITRGYTFGPEHVTVRLTLRETGYNSLLSLWVENPWHGHLKEAWEMIPFVPNKRAKSGQKPEATDVRGFDAAGKDLGRLTGEAITAQTVLIDRGGFGVRIELPAPHAVSLGEKNTVLVRLIDEPGSANGVELSYRVVPFLAR